MKFKLLTAAVVMAMAGTANAALVGSTSGNSTLVFTAWDTNAPTVGFARDLGLTFNDYRPGAGVLASGFSQTFLADPEFALTFGSNLSTVVWNVSAGDGNATPGVGISGRELLTTGPLNGVGLTQTTTTAGVTAVFNNMETTFNLITTEATGCATNPSCDTTRPGDPLLWQDAFGGTLAVTNAAAIGNSLGFYSIIPGANNRTKPTFAAYQNADGFATWTFGTDGVLKYQTAAAAAVVPVPAAIWLMGSALIGLLGVARRQTSETNVVAA